MATRGRLRENEIDRFIDNDGFIISDSDSNSGEISIDNVGEELLRGEYSENESDSNSVDSDFLLDDENNVGLPDIEEDIVSIGNEPTDHLPDEPVDNLDLRNVEDIINKVALGDVGLWTFPTWYDKSNVPKNILFFGNDDVGVNIPNYNVIDTELDCLEHFLTNEILNHIVQQTNLYAQKCFADGNRRKRKDDSKWVDCTLNEMKSFFALVIIMAVVQKPTLQSYWSKRKVLETCIFTEVMSFRRFQIIMRFLHFANDSDADRSDKLKKIRPIISFFNNKFKENYTPDRDESVDESLVKFRGRLSCVQFNRTKRARFGINFFKICESKSGYCSGFDIYTGKKNVPKGVMVSEEVVMELLQPYLEKGYICHIDNWYSSPNLFRRLLDYNTYAVGTVRSTRRNMPIELKTGKLEVGEAQRRSLEGVLVVKWMDKKMVYCISTFHTDIDYQPTGRYAHPTRNRRGYEIMKPKLIIDYNNGMLAVDRQDQVLSYDPVIRQYSKGYKKIFFYIFDMCLFNAYVVYCQIKGGKKCHFVDFKTNIAEQMLSSLEQRVRPTSGRPSLSNPTRLQGQHFPMSIPATPKKEFPTKRCAVCKEYGIRKESRIQCKQLLWGYTLSVLRLIIPSQSFSFKPVIVSFL